MTIKERNEQLLKFINLAEAQRTMYKGCPKNVGLTLDSIIQVGIDMEIVVWLRKNHYISVHEDKPIWIAWENKFYPNRTIENLKKWLNIYKENK